MFSTNNAFTFLLDIIQNLVLLIFMARLAFQLVKVNIHNPVSQFVFQFTTPVLKYFKGVFPTIKRFNIATLIVLILLCLAFTVIKFSLNNITLNLVTVTIFSTRLLIITLLDFVFWSLVLQIIFSWLPNANFHPMAQISYLINSPILKPIRTIIPTISNIDFSPMIALIAIKFIEILILG